MKQIALTFIIAQCMFMQTKAMDKAFTREERDEIADSARQTFEQGKNDTCLNVNIDTQWHTIKDGIPLTMQQRILFNAIMKKHGWIGSSTCTHLTGIVSKTPANMDAQRVRYYQCNEFFRQYLTTYVNKELDPKGLSEGL